MKKRRQKEKEAKNKEEMALQFQFKSIEEIEELLDGEVTDIHVQIIMHNYSCIRCDMNIRTQMARRGDVPQYQNQPVT